MMSSALQKQNLYKLESNLGVNHAVKGIFFSANVWVASAHKSKIQSFIVVYNLAQIHP